MDGPGPCGAVVFAAFLMSEGGELGAGGADFLSAFISASILAVDLLSRSFINVASCCWAWSIFSPYCIIDESSASDCAVLG